jgi:FAD/FMN-containing dehydrogenase
MRRGLYITVPGGGSQVSVIANHLNCGFSPLNYRNGLPSRRLLGVEWILPDGEMLKTGSLALGTDPFWGEGPGPELKGILRGASAGWLGSFGVCTKMAIKLFPFQPERLEPIGISPDTTLQLPPKRMRWINFTLPSREALILSYKSQLYRDCAAMTKAPVF